MRPAFPINFALVNQFQISFVYQSRRLQACGRDVRGAKNSRPGGAVRHRRAALNLPTTRGFRRSIRAAFELFFAVSFILRFRAEFLFVYLRHYTRQISKTKFILLNSKKNPYVFPADVALINEGK